jgi:hypothetical protein
MTLFSALPTAGHLDILASVHSHSDIVRPLNPAVSIQKKGRILANPPRGPTVLWYSKLRYYWPEFEALAAVVPAAFGTLK